MTPTTLNALTKPGCWPAMLTPFRDDGRVDEQALRALVEFYLEQGAQGLLATCFSSETQYLEWAELEQVIRVTVSQVAGRVPVAATPHAGVGAVPVLARQVARLHELGVACVVVVAAQVGTAEESDAVLCERLEALPGASLGIYESPKPYHRLLGADALRRLAATGRYHFHKDTSCHLPSVLAKVDAVRGTALRFTNAHGLTLLDSLRAGGAGYCGVGANFYPEVYRELCEKFAADEALANTLHAFLVEAEVEIRQSGYPAGAKWFLRKRGLKLSMRCRMPSNFGEAEQAAMERLWLRWQDLVVAS